MSSTPYNDTVVVEHPLIRLAKRLTTITIENAITKFPATAMINARYIQQTLPSHPKLQGYGPLSTIDIWSKIVQDQGMLAIWRGYPLDVAKTLIQFFLNPIAFAIQRQLIPRFNPNIDFVKFYVTSIGGGYLTGLFLQATLRPLEYCRVKLALDTVGKREYEGVLDVLKKTVKGPSGVVRIYSGFSAAMAKTLVYRISYFALYDIIRAFDPYARDRGAIGLLSKFLTSQFVTLASLVLSYPFDVVERRMQAQADKKEDERHYKGTFASLKKIYKEEGISGLYSGIQNNLTTVIFTSVALLAIDMMFK